MPSNLWLEPDAMRTDFQFLAGTEHNFDPQYDLPCPKLPSLDVRGSLKAYLQAPIVQKYTSFPQHPS